MRDQIKDFSLRMLKMMIL